VIRTLIAEPVTLTREGLIALLSRERDIELVAVVRHGADAVPAARALQPDVALLAAAFPARDGNAAGARGRGCDGIAVAAATRAAAPGCRCAIVSPGWRSRDLERAAAAEIRGLLACDAPPEYLAAAVRQLAAGNEVMDPRLARTARSPLTARESDVLRVAAQGLTTAGVATALCLAEGTVRNYLSRAIAKTGARNRVDAIRIAGLAGWIE
jgi:two-component system, NarL family, response regulator DesR